MSIWTSTTRSHLTSPDGMGVSCRRRMFRRQVACPRGASSDRSRPPGSGAADRRSGLLRGFDELLAPIGAGLLEGLGERLPRGREDLDERVPVTSQAPELGRVAEVEPDPERVAVVPPDPLNLRLQLLPSGHGTSILTPCGLAPVAPECG